MGDREKEKQSFLLYKDRRPLVEACSDEQAGQLFKGIYSYACGDGAPAFDDPLLAGIFAMFRQTIDADTDAWESKRKKAVESVSKRWSQEKAEEPEEIRPNTTEYDGIRPNTTEYDRKKNDAFDTVTVTVTDNVTVIDNPPLTPPTGKSDDKPEPKKAGMHKVTARKIFEACIQDFPISPELQATMETWLRYKTERRESYKEQGLRALIKKAAEAEAESGTAAVIDVIETSMANRYQGITWDRIKRTSRASPVKKNQFTAGVENNSYDFDALEKELAANGL